MSVTLTTAHVWTLIGVLIFWILFVAGLRVFVVTRSQRARQRIAGALGTGISAVSDREEAVAEKRAGLDDDGLARKEKTAQMRGKREVSEAGWGRSSRISSGSAQGWDGLS
jgi:hypothetical protein